MKKVVYKSVNQTYGGYDILEVNEKEKQFSSGSTRNGYALTCEMSKGNEIVEISPKLRKKFTKDLENNSEWKKTEINQGKKIKNISAMER